MPSTSSRNRPRNSACTSDRVSVSGRVVVVDANVLYSIELTDLLLTLATRRLVRLHWSPMILDEVRRNLAVRPDLSAEAIDYRLRRMNLAVPAALDEPPASLVQQMAVNEHDRHVLALAVHVEADTIATFNLRDFPAAVCELHGVGATHPDDIALSIAVDDRNRTEEALVEMAAR